MKKAKESLHLLALFVFSMPSVIVRQQVGQVFLDAELRVVYPNNHFFIMAICPKW